MLSLIARKVLQAFCVLFLVTILNFTASRSLPGDPLDVMLGQAQRDMSPEALATLREDLGLNEPPVKQYFIWLKSWMAGTSPQAKALGLSYRDRRPVKEVVLERLPLTLALFALALALALVGGFLAGLGLAYLHLRAWESQEKRQFYLSLEESLSLALISLYSLPNFLAAYLALPFLAGPWLNFPCPLIATGAPALDLALPAFFLCLRRLAKIATFLHNLAKEELKKGYVRQAMARGMAPAVILGKHIFKNCLPPLLQILSFSITSLLGGSVLIETIFGQPGLGQLLIESALGRNYPVIMALGVLYAFLAIITNLLTDLLMLSFDRRLAEVK